MSIIGRVMSLIGVRGRPALEPVTYRPIGVVRNPVRHPRPHGWAELRSDLILREELADALEALDAFSHALVIFHFSRVGENDRPTTVPLANDSRPPVGVLATRIAPRPNPIGVSVVRVVRRRKNVLRVIGLDALDGTPVLDIKPYLPEFDAVAGATIPDWARRTNE
jgi:tRNA-Thr(GGU) m(6)t(6)A37 methyltransferase TsaA